MPAPAVIPAPIAYINAAAVKKLVVGSRVQVARWPSYCVFGFTVDHTVIGVNPLRQDLYSINGGNGALRVGTFIGVESAYAYTIRSRVDRRRYCEQTSVSKASVVLNGKAWNNKGSILSDLFVGS